MQPTSTQKTPQALAAHLLEVICCGEVRVSRLCQLEHLPSSDIDRALAHLQTYGYVERAGDMVHLKDSKSTIEFCGHVKHPAMGRIHFEFSTLADATQTERDAAAFCALVASMNHAGIEIQYIETVTVEWSMKNHA